MDMMANEWQSLMTSEPNTHPSTCYYGSLTDTLSGLNLREASWIGTLPLSSSQHLWDPELCGTSEEMKIWTNLCDGSPSIWNLPQTPPMSPSWKNLVNTSPPLQTLIPMQQEPYQPDPRKVVVQPYPQHLLPLFPYNYAEDHDTVKLTYVMGRLNSFDPLNQAVTLADLNNLINK
ncbi:MAG: hypothetical protein [Cressdnaviricota sp.]|nr:MAG: hypothetical protein [Cressdnaviricota sp.]